MSDLFSVRIVTVDFYMAAPLQGFDILYSGFRGSSVSQVPIIRVFGSTLSGRKVCVHIHGAFPYIYIPYDGVESEAGGFMYKTASSIDKAVNISLNHAASNAQHVYKVVLVSGIPMYGYHRKEHQFLKIYFYNPLFVRKVSNLLQNENTLGKIYQPHEAHLNFILQFMIDYNLHGMSQLLISKLKFRKDSNVPDMDHPEFTAISKSTTCEIEIDILVDDIFNQKEIADGKLSVNPGIAAIWEDEKRRRRNKEQDSQIGPCLSLTPNNCEPTKSHQMFKQALLERLAVFEDSPIPESSESLNNSVYPSETPEGAYLPNASTLDLHCSLDSSILDDTISPLNATLSPSELDSTMDAESRQLYDLLQSLARENKTDEHLEEDSILSQIVKEDEEEFDLSMPLEAATTPQKIIVERQETEDSNSEDEDLDNTLNVTIIPQLDGNDDDYQEKTRVTKRKRKRKKLTEQSKKKKISVKKNQKHIPNTVKQKLVLDMPTLDYDLNSNLPNFSSDMDNISFVRSFPSILSEIKSREELKKKHMNEIYKTTVYVNNSILKKKSTIKKKPLKKKLLINKPQCNMLNKKVKVKVYRTKRRSKLIKLCTKIFKQEQNICNLLRINGGIPKFNIKKKISNKPDPAPINITVQYPTDERFIYEYKYLKDHPKIKKLKRYNYGPFTSQDMYLNSAKYLYDFEYNEVFREVLKQSESDFFDTLRRLKLVLEDSIQFLESKEYHYFVESEDFENVENCGEYLENNKEYCDLINGEIDCCSKNLIDSNEILNDEFLFDLEDELDSPPIENCLHSLLTISYNENDIYTEDKLLNSEKSKEFNLKEKINILDNIIVKEPENYIEEYNNNNNDNFELKTFVEKGVSTDNFFDLTPTLHFHNRSLCLKSHTYDSDTSSEELSCSQVMKKSPSPKKYRNLSDLPLSPLKLRKKRSFTLKTLPISSPIAHLSEDEFEELHQLNCKRLQKYKKRRLRKLKEKFKSDMENVLDDLELDSAYSEFLVKSPSSSLKSRKALTLKTSLIAKKTDELSEDECGELNCSNLSGIKRLGKYKLKSRKSKCRFKTVLEGTTLQDFKSQTSISEESKMMKKIISTDGAYDSSSDSNDGNVETISKSKTKKMKQANSNRKWKPLPVSLISHSNSFTSKEKDQNSTNTSAAENVKRKLDFTDISSPLSCTIIEENLMCSLTPNRRKKDCIREYKEEPNCPAPKTLNFNSQIPSPILDSPAFPKTSQNDMDYNSDEIFSEEDDTKLTKAELYDLEHDFHPTAGPSNFYDCSFSSSNKSEVPFNHEEYKTDEITDDSFHLQLEESDLPCDNSERKSIHFDEMNNHYSLIKPLKTPPTRKDVLNSLLSKNNKSNAEKILTQENSKIAEMTDDSFHLELEESDFPPDLSQRKHINFDELKSQNSLIKPIKVPPTRKDILSSLSKLNLPYFKFDEPFYSNVSDAGASMEVGLNLLKVCSKTTLHVPDFNSHCDALTNYRKTFFDSLSVKYTRANLNNLSLSYCTNRPILLKPVKRPPSVAKVKDWIENRSKCKLEQLKQQVKSKISVFIPQSPGHEDDEEVHNLNLSLTPVSSKNSQNSDQVNNLNNSKPNKLSDDSLNNLLLPSQVNVNDSCQITGISNSSNETFSKSIENYQTAKTIENHELLTLLVMELHTQTRGDFKPNPEFDSIRAIFYSVFNDSPETEEKPKLAKGIIAVNSTFGASKNKANILDAIYFPENSFKEKVTYVTDEENLIKEFTNLIHFWDPDIFAGYEIELLSWGYLIERANILGINLVPEISRTKEVNKFRYDEETDCKVAGRIVLDIWRLMRHEIALQSYTFENLAYHILNRRVPTYTFKDLSFWWEHKTNLYRHRTVKHYMIRVELVLDLFEKLDLIGRTSELARLFGIQFYEVLSRGSQFRVESMMLRLAKPLNFIAVSPSVQQRAKMRAPEFIPLVLEPESKMYTDPVIVLDFQSLYPSIIIAYNYCFTTSLGRVEHLGKEGPFEFGATQLRVPKNLLKRLVKKDLINYSPCGVAFVKTLVRDGILPRMLREILDTRLMVKNSMKENKDNTVLKKVLHNRQLGLKLIANVTYGYTSANFSGRMPAVEIGDSVVSKGRETLHRAIAMVDNTPEWGARVVYGDTDSLFVMVPGKSKEHAFEIGQKIADAITNDNPNPVKLKLEKVYQPCILQTKKRYVGYMYESADQKEPIFEAKGIETVRRDGCPAVAKMLQKTLRILFETKNVSLVKRYVLKQFNKVLAGRASIQDLTFAKEYRGAPGYKPGACVPALELARRWTAVDKRNEPRSGERVPYVIVNGPPGFPLIRLVKSPNDLLNDPSLTCNALYYITKVIIPPLNRCFNLIGVDMNIWFNDMPRKVIKLYPTSSSVSPGKKSTISQYFASTNCVNCNKQGQKGLCESCCNSTQKTVINLMDKMQKIEMHYQNVTKFCQLCTGMNDFPCVSLDCPVLYRRTQTARDFQQIPHIRQVMESLIKLEF